MEDEALLTGVAALVGVELARQAASRRFVRGEDLYRQGDKPSDLLLLRSGRVKIWRATEVGGAFTLTLLSRDALVGTLGVVAAGAYETTATAVTVVDVLFWRLSDVRRVLGANPALAMTMLRTVSVQATGMVRRLEEVSAIPVEQRLARILLRTEGSDEEDEHGRNQGLPLSRQDLADLAFSTLATVSRIMSRWRERGLVDGGRGRVCLLDRPGLAEVAGGQARPDADR